MRSDLYSISGTLIDARYNKLFDISRGYWEAYNPCPYNSITEEYKDKYSDRYFVAESTEYCGVLIDFYTALYDYVDEKIYWVQGDNCFRDRDKKEFPGTISSPGGAGDYECNEYTYTLTEITKEELLDELKDFKIG